MDTDFAPHNLVNNGGVLCRASASSTGGAQPFQAFDNSSVTGWISNTGDPTGWLQLWIAVPQKLKSYSITAGTQYWQYDNGNRLPKNFTMQGSADGVAWDVLDTRVNQTGWTEGQTRNFVCNSPTATRYNFFRVVITANNGDADYVQIGELNLYTDDLNPVQYLDRAPHAMSDNTTPSPYVAHASSNDSIAYRAFDGVVAFDNRAGFSALPGWLSIDLGQERTVVFYAISMYFYTNFTTQTPNTWFLEGSNDNANWTILDSQSGQVGWSEYETRNFPVASPGSYRYYRIRVTTNNGDAFTPVGELYLFEWATPVPQYPDPSQVLLGIVYAYGALAGTMVQTSDRPVPVDHLMPPATKNVAYSETISARYGTAPCTFAVTVGDLPPGLSLDPETGIVSGTPTTTGAYEFTVTATDAEASEGSSAFSITVSEPAAGGGNSCF